MLPTQKAVRFSKLRPTGPFSSHFRSFHRTPEKKFLPVIVGGLAIAVVATGARYIARGLRKLEEEERKERRAQLNDEEKEPGSGLRNSPMSRWSNYNGPVLGIDLGSSNGRVAACAGKGRPPEVLENAAGARATPAALAFQDGAVVVGRHAAGARWLRPAEAAWGLPQLLGLAHGDPRLGEIFDGAPPPGLVADPGGAGVALAGGGAAGPLLLGAVDMNAELLRALASTAAGKVGGARPTVLAVPAGFDGEQTAALLEAAALAGLEVAGTLPEPVAALLACRTAAGGAAAAGAQEAPLLPGLGAGAPVAVVDVGGRQATVSVVAAGDHAPTDPDDRRGEAGRLVGTATCLATGGEHLDAALVEDLVRHFRATVADVDFSQDGLALQRLYEAAEIAKIELSRGAASEINLPYLTADASGPKHLVRGLGRPEWERIAGPVLDRALPLCERALNSSNVSKSELQAVILVGGCSRIPRVQAMAKEWFGLDPVIPINSEEITVIGAAMEARRLVLGS